MIETGRRLLDAVLDYASKLYRADRVLVLEAPTGYGKSVSVPAIAAINTLNSFSYNFIHVLPLRAIVEDLYLCKYLYALGIQVDADRCRSPPPKAFRESLNVLGVGVGDVAYQMGLDYMIRGIGRKEPIYDARIVISTLDSFSYNFLRIPVTEIFREVKHYAIPRARIFTSTIFLDEVHMIKRFDDESSGKALSLLKMLIEFSLATKTPLVMATATLWTGFRSRIADWARNQVAFFVLSKEDSKNGSFVYIRDREFEYRAKSIRWVTSVVDESVVHVKVLEHVEKGEKVLVVRDRVKDAVELYNRLDLAEDEKVLIHSRLCIEDRENALNKIEKAKVVVATPIVEAGVDWDFDVGLRDATNIPSMVQVFGRVCRNRDGCEGSVYLVKTGESLGSLIEFVKDRRYIDWRIPYSYISERGEEAIGYQSILEMQNMVIEEDKRAERLIRALVTPITLPSSYINIALEDYGYSVLREPLAQFYVYGKQSIVSARNASDIIHGSFTYTLEIIEEKSRCIEGYACVTEHDEEIYSEFLDPRERYQYLQKKCLEIASKIRWRVLFSGYIVKDGCYKKGLGLL